MKKFNKDTCVYKVCIGEVKMTSKEMYITSCIGLTQVWSQRGTDLMDQDTCKHGVITSVMEEMRFFGKTLNEDMVNACAYLLQSHQGLSDMMDLDNTYLEWHTNEKKQHHLFIVEDGQDVSEIEVW